MTWNDLLIEILNMSKEEREQLVRVADSKMWASDTSSLVEEVYNDPYNDIYLIHS
jgi:hypothetical protein